MEIKICQSCLKEKNLGDFPVRNDQSGRIRPYCKPCANKANRSRYASYKRNSPWKLRATKKKATCKERGIAYDLDAAHLEEIWTGFCPVFGVKIDFDLHRNNENAAEIDRIEPEKGYVKGNVAWLSRKANRIKNNASPNDIEKLNIWMQSIKTGAN